MGKYLLSVSIEKRFGMYRGGGGHDKSNHVFPERDGVFWNVLLGSSVMCSAFVLDFPPKTQYSAVTTKSFRDLDSVPSGLIELQGTEFGSCISGMQSRTEPQDYEPGSLNFERDNMGTQSVGDCPVKYFLRFPSKKKRCLNVNHRGKV